MKIARHLVSNNGMLVVTVCLLMIAAALMCEGVMMEASSPLANLPLFSDVGNSITSYVMAGVMGKIPSTAGTYQSIGLFVGYVATPFTVAVMFAIKANLGIDDDSDDLVTA